jgi:hypothetical protein
VSRDWYRENWAIGFSACEHRPRDARQLVRQGNDGDIRRRSPIEGVEPGTEPQARPVRESVNRPSTVNEHPPQVVNPAFRNTEQCRPTSGRMLTRHQSGPSGEIPTANFYFQVASSGLRSNHSVWSADLQTQSSILERASTAFLFAFGLTLPLSLN